MTTDRRSFVRNAALGIASGAMAPTLTAEGAAAKAAAGGDVSRYLVNPGPKETVRGLKAAVSTGSSITTETIVKVLRDGGNAVDAAIAGALVQAAIEPHHSNHTGTITLVCYEAKTGKLHQLNSTGTFPGGMAPVRTGQQEGEGGPGGRVSLGSASACIPGFMPGIKAMYQKFGTRPWASLCDDAIRWAEEGHPVSSFEYGYYCSALEGLTYFPEGRKFFMPDGYLVPVGQRFASKELAKTLRGVQRDGPDYMIEGEWAREFIATANRMGWEIKAAHMTETPPRWSDPLRFRHHEYEIVGHSPPLQQGVFCSIVMGILRHLGIRNLEPYGAEHLFYMSHALRWGLYHCGYLGDPVVADYATEQLLDDDLHASIAKLIRGLRPKIDLTEHVKLTHSPRGSAGMITGDPEGRGPNPSTCELSVVDREGNWVQMTHTLQSGGIPGMVIGGVVMNGSNTLFTGISGDMDSKLIAGTRMRRSLGNTIVLRDGKPAFSLGSPGNVYFTVPQILTALLDFKMDPYAAVDAPRVMPLAEYGNVTVEDRVSEKTIDGLLASGVGVQALPAYQWQMGSYQMCFRDPKTGLLGAVTDPRRCGVADGLR
jgi:gamma-glutamyltranspeptidase/glutathione hydrolase